MILSPCGTIQGYWNKWFKRNITWLKIPTGWMQTSWLSTSVTEDLNSGLPRTNPESDQGGSWTRGLRITFNSLYSGHCIRRGLEFVSSLARVRNSRSLFQWNVCNFLFAGDLATVRFIGVSVIAGCPQAESWLYKFSPLTSRSRRLLKNG